uniref:Uncharacterized protein n=1 Tax=Oryza meridionalis TaxID=40149 RepID=A0A0E0EDZ7_9ORYZ
MILARNSGHRGTFHTTAATTTNFTTSAKRGTLGSDGERKGGRDVGRGEGGNGGTQHLSAKGGRRKRDSTERKRERRKKPRKKKWVVAGAASAGAGDGGGGQRPDSPTPSESPRRPTKADWRRYAATRMPAIRRPRTSTRIAVPAALHGSASCFVATIPPPHKPPDAAVVASSRDSSASRHPKTPPSAHRPDPATAVPDLPPPGRDPSLSPLPATGENSTSPMPEREHHRGESPAAAFLALQPALPAASSGGGEGEETRGVGAGGGVRPRVACMWATQGSFLFLDEARIF